MFNRLPIIALRGDNFGVQAVQAHSLRRAGDGTVASMFAGRWLLVTFRSRRFWTLLLVFGLILSDLYFAFDKWGEPIRLQARLLHDQRRCLNFEEPVDRIVFDTDANRVDKLLKSADYFKNSQADGEIERAATSRGGWELYDEYCTLRGQVELLRTPPVTPKAAMLADLDDALEEGGGAQIYSAIAFMHARNSDGYPTRLVIVTVSWLRGKLDYIQFDGQAFSVAGAWGTPKRLAPSSTKSNPLQCFDQFDRPAIRVFAGQAMSDQSDGWTIAIETPLGRNTVEGRLNPDDSITLKLLDAPIFTRTTGGSP